MKKANLTIIALTKLEQTQGLRRAVDQKVQRLTESARRNWEEQFAGKDPSDSCVSVRVHRGSSKKSELVHRSDFLKSATQSPESHKNKALLRFAH